MAKIPRKLKVEQIDWVQASLRTRRLPLSTYKDLHLTLYMIGTDTAATMTFDEFLRNVITRISIVLNGQDVIVNVPFYFLFYMNACEFAAAPYWFYDHANDTSQKKEISVILPFCLLRAANPQDTLLDARRLSSMILEVAWGALPGEMTAATYSGYLSINTGEYSSVAQDAAFARKEYGWDTIPFNAAGDIDHRLEVQSNNQYRRLWIFAWDNTTPTARVNDAITNIRVKSRSFHFLDYEADHLQFRNLLEYNQRDQGGATHDPVAADSSNIAAITGLYIVDFPDFGLMSQRCDARDLSELILQVTSANATDSMEVIKEKSIFA